MKAAKVFILLLTALIVVIFSDCSYAEKHGTEEIIHAGSIPSLSGKPVSYVESKPESSVPIIIESNTNEPSIIEFSVNNEKLFETLEDYFNADSTKEVIDQIISSAEEGTQKRVYIDDESTLVFETMIEQELTSAAAEEFGRKISESVEQNRDLFIGFVYELEDCIDNNDIKVLVKYIDNDNNTIFERSFSN